MNPWGKLFLLLGSILVIQETEAEPVSSHRSFSSTTASFVPLVAPPSRYASITVSSFHPTALYSKKKAAATKKVQVKLLKYVAGTGQAGDVVLVTPAFFQNKLRPTKSATPISDDEVQEAQSRKQQQEEARDAAASALKSRLQTEGFTLHVARKAGPDGQLFGGVSPKVIMEELKEKVRDDYWNEKQVKIVSVTQDGKKMRGDIKHVGEFGATISLTKDISVNILIQVDAED